MQFGIHDVTRFLCDVPPLVQNTLLLLLTIEDVLWAHALSQSAEGASWMMQAVKHRLRSLNT